MTDHSLLLEDPPGGWMQARLDDICRRVQDAASPSANGQRLYLGLEHLASGLPTLVGRGKESDVRSGKTTFRKDDILFGKLRPYLRKSVLVSEDGICSTDILVFRATEKCIPEFLCFLMHTDEFVGHAKNTTSGVQHPRTSWAALREFKLSVPPLPEQRKIAAVLGQVQQAIEQQERLIALTIELKKTLLHQLFTQGLRGEPQKQTEIGPVPESWEVVTIGEILQQIKIGYEPVIGGNTKYIGLEHIDTSFPFFTRNGFEADVKSSKYKFSKGHILYGKLRPYLDKAAIPEFDGVCSTDIIVLNGINISNWFLIYLIHSDRFIKYAKETTSGVQHPRTSWSNLKNLKIGLPTIEEREIISNTLKTIDYKLSQHFRKKQKLEELFRPLLHQLMTAEVRVDRLDLSFLEEEVCQS